MAVGKERGQKGNFEGGSTRRFISSLYFLGRLVLYHYFKWGERERDLGEQRREERAAEGKTCSPCVYVFVCVCKHFCSTPGERQMQPLVFNVRRSDLHFHRNVLFSRIHSGP